MGTRDATLEIIVESATGLFLERGIAAVSMEDIAKRSSCTRRTLYRYFAAKEQLVYETVIRLLEQWNEAQTAVFIGITGSGLKRLGDFLRALVGLLEERIPLLRLMGEFDFTFRDESGFCPDADAAKRFAEAARLSDDLMESMIMAGLADGSVRAGTDAAIVVPTISAVLWGTAQRVAIRDRMIQKEYGLSGAELIRAQIELYLKALEA